MTDLVDLGLAFHPARHEGVAVGMADGWSWANDDVGVVVLTRGPGLVNGLTAARSAVRGRRRLVIVTGDARTGSDHRADLKYIDPGPLAAAAGLVHLPITTAAQTEVTVQQAMATARGGRPVVITVPEDVLNGPITDPQIPTSSTPMPKHARPATPAKESAPAGLSPEQLAVVVEVLHDCRRPLILVGAGAVDAAVKPVLVDLAQRAGALLGTSLGARDHFRGHPLYLGTVGGWASDAAVTALSEIDTVISFGASLNSYTTAEGTLFTHARTVQIDHDPAALGRYLTVQHAMLADAGTAAAQLLAALPDGLNPQRPQHNPQTLAALRRPAYLGPDESSADELDPRGVALRLGEALPEARTVVLDSGRFMSWPGRFVPTTGVDGFRLTVEFGSISTGLGVALGVSVARGDDTVVLFVGDGGLSMVMGDLATVGQHQSPLVIAVFNDSSYGAERWHQERRGLPTTLADLFPIDFAAVAAAVGVEAVTIRTHRDLDRVAPRLRGLTRPLLLDLRIRRDLTLARYLSWA